MKQSCPCIEVVYEANAFGDPVWSFAGAVPLIRAALFSSPVLAGWFYKLISRRQLQALCDHITSVILLMSHVAQIDYSLSSFMSVYASLVAYYSKTISLGREWRFNQTQWKLTNFRVKLYLHCSCCHCNWWLKHSTNNTSIGNTWIIKVYTSLL